MSVSKYGFTKMDANEFKTWITKQSKTGFNGIQVHHTWSPSYSNFYKADGTHEDELKRQNNMKYFHVNSNGWGDIAQHFTIFPNGAIVTGRKLTNTTAIGIKGWNTNKICIEMYGNFDKGKDIMTEEQRHAMIVVYGELCKHYKITPSLDTIRLHSWFTSGGRYIGTYDKTISAKTCPGTNFMGIGNTKEAIRDQFIPLIKNYIKCGECATKPVTTPSTTKDYRVRVTTSSLNVRKGPGTSYSVTTTVKKGEVYTIVETQNNWGKLKSGAGWISLAYTEKI